VNGYTYSKEKEEWQKFENLSRRVLAGELKAYAEVLKDYSPFAEISGLGSSVRVTVHNAELLGCVLKIKGVQVIPEEVKTLTVAGRVSIKPMPRSRFHELYQDYICACLLRVARELFALLPVETVLATASADSLDPRTGQPVAQPVLSAAIKRAVMAGLQFQRLDPSHAMENFVHRGDFKASRKSGAFEPISPLTPADLTETTRKTVGFEDLLAKVRSLREEMKTEIGRLNPRPTEFAS